MRADKIRGPVYEFGEFRLDTAERVIECAGQPLSITPKALDVLIALIENRGRIVEKEDLMSRVWPQVFVEENNLAFNISVLRKLLGENRDAPRFIETVPKRGYRFIANVVEVSGNGSPGVEALKESLPIPPSRQGAKRPRLAWPWVSAAVLLSLAVAGIIALRSHRTPKLTDKSTIILADFVNKTGDPVFDGTLDRGLAVQLEQSPLFGILPDERIRRTLRLMGQPADARLTPALAQGVCARTGSAVVLEGLIAGLGSQYVIGLRARNCTTGEIVDDDQVKAARKEEVLDALSQIARNFRFRVGESPTTLKTHDTPLAEATTPSLEALKVYSAGLKVHFSSGAAAALPLFKRAVEIDPQFAMAYAYLGRAYANLDESELAAENIKQAWQLRNRVSDRERFAIATRYQALVTGNQEELRQTSEAWVQAYPRDPQPHIGLSIYYDSTGQHEKAAAEEKKAIEVDPDFAEGYGSLAAGYVYLNRLPEAEDVLRRAAARGLDLDEFAMVQDDIAFLRDNRAGLERAAERVRQESEDGSWMPQKAALVLAYSGRLEQARSMSQLAVSQARQAMQPERAALWETGAALTEAFFGNKTEAIKRATAALDLSADREVEYGAAFALALAGDSARSQILANDLEKRFPEDTSVQFSYLPALRSRLALNSGNVPKALELLQAATPNELGVPPASKHGLFGALYPVYVRGEVYLKAQRGAEATTEFEKIIKHRELVLADPIGAVARLQTWQSVPSLGGHGPSEECLPGFLRVLGKAGIGKFRF